ncbi:MAG: DUF2273 domain-containing protein [Clostridia bacterium]|nr:DUF2273 domain-containing protein [Clostridia bacterium]
MSSELLKRIIGAAAGVAIGMMMLFIGFFRTLLLAALGAAGWWLCGSRALPKPLKDIIDRIRNQFSRP